MEQGQACQMEDLDAMVASICNIQQLMTVTSSDCQIARPIEIPGIRSNFTYSRAGYERICLNVIAQHLSTILCGDQEDSAIFCQGNAARERQVTQAAIRIIQAQGTIGATREG